MSLVAESSTENFAPCGPLLGELGAQNLIISMSVQYKLSLNNLIKIRPRLLESSCAQTNQQDDRIILRLGRGKFELTIAQATNYSTNNIHGDTENQTAYFSHIFTKMKRTIR